MAGREGTAQTAEEVAERVVEAIEVRGGRREGAHSRGSVAAHGTG